MEKKHKNYLSRSLASGSLWAVGFFAIFGIALYTYAISFPATQPNPVSGVVGLFVGSTQDLYNGQSVGGYEAANASCQKAYEYSHVCTAMEMVNTYNHNPSAINGQAQSFWINNGLVGNAVEVTNDCKGWTTQDPKVFGSIWSSSKKQGYLASCDMSRSIACCR